MHTVSAVIKSFKNQIFSNMRETWGRIYIWIGIIMERRIRISIKTMPIHLLGYTFSPVKAAGELFAANLCAEMVELCAAELAALVPPAGPLLLAPLLTPAPGHDQHQ